MLHSMNVTPSLDFHPRLNYIEEANPFGLSGPPTSFLSEMWLFDPLLVIFPSKEEAVYRLARRVEHGPPILTFLKSRPDTQMFARYRLTPVTSIVPFAKWGPVLLHDLAVRDIRRIGGHRSAADALDQQDTDAERLWESWVQDQATIRARASWNGQKWSRGETLDLGGRRVHGARTTPHRKTFSAALRPSGSGEGAVFLGREDRILKEVRPFDGSLPAKDRGLIVAA